MSKALIVDDHPFIRATVKHLLQLEGFDEIFQAGDGADAMQLAREQRPELLARPYLRHLRPVPLDAPCARPTFLRGREAEVKARRKAPERPPPRCGSSPLPADSASRAC